MSRRLLNWGTEILLLIIYKTLVEFVFLKQYMKIFSYVYTNANYNFSFDKWCLGSLIFAGFLFVIIIDNADNNPIYSYVIRFIYTVCIIPMLSVYAFFTSIRFINILYPLVFWSLVIFWLKKQAQKREQENQLIRIPKILHINTILLVVCALIAFVIWLVSGRPVFFSFDAALDQRIQLRSDAMPTLLAYIFMLLGSTVFPYLFAKYLEEKKHMYSLVSLFCGIILFFVNGMKTWLFLYLFYVGIALIIKIGKEDKHKTNILIEVMMILLVSFCIVTYRSFKIVDFTSQLARVIIIPNETGFVFLEFFQKTENPYLFLRESVLRLLFDTPYLNGSDFYVTHGTNVTISSARANNGLWGDAYRNFGVLGIVVYPFFITKFYYYVETNCRHMKTSMRLFILFMVIWSSINNSFFTWLLTGGVLVLILLEKIDRSNTIYNETKEFSEKLKGTGEYNEYRKETAK